MAEQIAGQRAHFQLPSTGQAEPYRYPGGQGRDPVYARLDRNTHGRGLLQQLGRVQQQLDTAVALQRRSGKEAGLGLQIEFQSQPGMMLAFESLGRDTQRIELLNVRRGEAGTSWATVFVPDGQLKTFEKLVTAYLTKGSAEKPRNVALINTIQEIRAATFYALWTDTPQSLPENSDEAIWWEFWLPVRENQAAVLQRFVTYANALGFRTSTQPLFFPERTVLNVLGSQNAITAAMALLNEVAEIRRAKETADFFDGLEPGEQREWVEELLERTTPGDDGSVRICLIDTGVNAGHPLLATHIDSTDLYAIDSGWVKDDEHGHGTGLAGVALYGDLCESLESQEQINLSHRLESVKLLRQAEGNEQEQYGSLTMMAVAQPEIDFPERKRIFSMAITSVDDRDRGRPSAWSAAVDSLASDSLGEGENPRLFIVSAGNSDPEQWGSYPTSNQSDGIHDPGQAWNALCVGAYTQKDRVVDYTALATRGSLSPFSTTSMTWQGSPWPIKPDVVFEGGNLAKNAEWICTHQDLMLLTTSHKPQQRLFSTTWATSAASALAARMAAQICAAYPNLRPETVRALMVHSAEWTDSMKAEFLAGQNAGDYERLIRICGFGVPDIKRALWSASNSLTLIVEDELQPYWKNGTNPPSANDMHLHRLPWPKEELLHLGNADVELRVTLSYFIEPNPGVMERGIKGRYRYESHGLRFHVSRPGEDADQFRYRVNQTAREQDEDGLYQGAAQFKGWRVGSNARHHGSLHSDIWVGSAANLSGLGIIAISPASGWFKTNQKKHRFLDRVKYSLVVSIKTQQTEIDLYSVIETKIAAANVVVV